ncbi:hypothetical protein CO166_02290 [Candidatus Roizmanbacteria bacterium CG_4_9_14_3_um_filter_36_11]|nr:MAG: hypothetical protein CO166_02290 [Candidatus Roizmanbacteria bacterium CG_4_9_14_3_um_filter_36_11]
MILIFNGPQNSGKSTIAKLLQKHIPQLAHIEVDGLRKFIYWMDGNDAFPMSIENAILVAKNFTKKGLAVVMTYIFSDEELKNTIESLKEAEKPVHVFTFSPKLETALTNRGTRELSEYEKERIKYHYQTGINRPSIGTIIDNTSQTPEETIKVILSHIQKDISLITAKFKIRDISNRK